MKRDLWSTKSTRDDDSAAKAPAADPHNVIDQYSGMNESQLMQQLRFFRQSGQMDDAALEQMAQTVSPMLSEDQRTRLKALLEQLRQ